MFPTQLNYPTLQMTQDLMDVGAYFTRSKKIAKKVHKCRIPRSVSTNMTYQELDSTSDMEQTKPQKRQKMTPPASGPSATRVQVQSMNSEPLKVCPLALKCSKTVSPVTSEDEVDTNEIIDAPIPPVVVATPKDAGENSIKGKLAVQSYTVKKLKKIQKYKCRICLESVNSAHLLTVHHQTNHGILYCSECTKAFNNPTSLERHKYQHKILKYVCDCGAHFQFKSQLQTHSIVHRKHPEHHCVYPRCNKLFKNKGDLTQHADEHLKQKHQCPDCAYSNSDVWNLESHWRQHSNIKPFHCDKCGEDFKYNMQYRRHINGKSRIKCKGLNIKTSNSPEYWDHVHYLWKQCMSTMSTIDTYQWTWLVETVADKGCSICGKLVFVKMFILYVHPVFWYHLTII